MELKMNLSPFKRLFMRKMTPAVYYILMFLFSVGNLLIMHYYIVGHCSTETPLDCMAYTDNVLSIFIDVTVLAFVSLLITRRRLKPSLAITYAVTLCWAFSNVMYSRFFGIYMPFSAICQVSNLSDGFMIRCIVDGFRMSDLLFVIPAILFIIIYHRTDNLRPRCKSIISSFLAILLTVLSVNCCFAAKIAKSNPYCNSFMWNLNTRYYRYHMTTLFPLWATFVRGTLRMNAVMLWNDPMTAGGISEEDRKSIDLVVADHSLRKTDEFVHPEIQNIIFIIVESYLSLLSDMKVGNIEVTPNLNRLKCENNVYYNGRMKSDITIGESADGQFIYMTGLLPLRNTITVNKAQWITLPGLPKMLKYKYPKMTSRMVIPTRPTFWNQSTMTRQYGFDRLYSTSDYEKETGGTLTKEQVLYGEINDEQIFSLAMAADNKSEDRFFSLILTMSMHSPYNHVVGGDTLFADKSFPEEFNNYLTAAHYTDMHIGRYLQHLKEKGIYDNSLIIIAADHYAHDDLLDMKGKISNDVPLYIINGNIDSGNAFTGECHQLDVYTTILDLLGIETEWRGLGHTLLHKDFVPSVDDDMSNISEKIIRGDYFRKK